ncbi:hypothetical protein Hanom_Chr10g00959081 [Helianthus anomalus]
MNTIYIKRNQTVKKTTPLLDRKLYLHKRVHTLRRFKLQPVLRTEKRLYGVRLQRRTIMIHLIHTRVKNRPGRNS